MSFVEPERPSVAQRVRSALADLNTAYERREPCGVSISEMARACEVSHTEFGRILSGDRKLGVEQMLKLPRAARRVVMAIVNEENDALEERAATKLLPESRARRVVKIYLASSWRNEQQPVVLAALRAAGHEVYDFKNPAPGNVGFGWRQCHSQPPPWSAAVTAEVLDTPRAVEGFAFDFDAMRWADAIVMLQPCGRSAALELGWGCGAGKLTIALLVDGQEPELMLKMAKHLCTSTHDLLVTLAAEEL